MTMCLGMTPTGRCVEHRSGWGAVRCFETQLRTDFRLPGQGWGEAEVEMKKSNLAVALLRSLPRLRALLPGKVFWVRKAVCSGRISTDGHWDPGPREALVSPWPAGLLEPGSQPLLLITELS